MDTTCAKAAFEEYMAQHGIVGEHETLPGRKKPDFLIRSASGPCIIEVKEIENPDPMPVRSFEPDRPVRAKIQAARKQLREYKHLPCGLAIYSESPFGPYDPSIVLSAAFGPGYQQTGRDYTRIDPRPPFYRFLPKSRLPEDKHFLANAALSKAANTTFSAIILLTWYQLSELPLEAWRRTYGEQGSGKPVSTQNYYRHLQELYPTLGGLTRYCGIIRAIVIENRHARIPFPQDLFRGSFDQRWTWWKDEWCGPGWVGETSYSLYTQGVPFHML